VLLSRQVVLLTRVMHTATGSQHPTTNYPGVTTCLPTILVSRHVMSTQLRFGCIAPWRVIAGQAANERIPHSGCVSEATTPLNHLSGIILEDRLVQYVEVPAILDLDSTRRENDDNAHKQRVGNLAFACSGIMCGLKYIMKRTIYLGCGFTCVSQTNKTPEWQFLNSDTPTTSMPSSERGPLPADAPKTPVCPTQSRVARPQVFCTRDLHHHLPMFPTVKDVLMRQGNIRATIFVKLSCRAGPNLTRGHPKPTRDCMLPDRWQFIDLTIGRVRSGALSQTECMAL
jgi:hypothetical protein